MAKILCIDNNQAFGSYVCARLKDAGHVCLLEKQGNLAIKMAETHGVDLVIAEVMLPDVCGFEICRRIRVHPDLFTLPVILMSSMAAEDEVQHGFAQGADDYLVKPFDQHTLVSRVNEQLRNASLAQQPDATTGLLGAKMIKAIIQRAITQKIPFATAYVELENIADFGKLVGDAYRNKALRHLSQILERYGKSPESPLFHAAHIGLGHFVCVLEPGQVTPFCERISASWDKHLPELYESAGLKMPNGALVAGKPVPQLNLMICITDSEVSDARSVKEYFDVLAQLRKKAVNQGRTGLHRDNRKSLKRTRARS